VVVQTLASGASHDERCAVQTFRASPRAPRKLPSGERSESALCAQRTPDGASRAASPRARRASDGGRRDRDPRRHERAQLRDADFFVGLVHGLEPDAFAVVRRLVGKLEHSVSAKAVLERDPQVDRKNVLFICHKKNLTEC